MWIPLLAGATIAVGSNWFRSGSIRDLELTPNCLLTRYPLVFVSGPRSLFYFRHYWNSGPRALAEHGYDVHIVTLARLKPSEQAQQILRLIDGQKVHLLGDSSSHQVFEALSEMESPVQSLTLLAGQAYKPPAHWHLQTLKGQAKPRVERVEEQAVSVPLLPARLSLALHNVSRRLQGTDPVESAAVGLVPDAQTFVRQLLRISISLAEQDASVMT